MQKKSLYPQDYNPEESIAALATPWGESALAVIRLSGVDSLKLLAGIFSRGGEIVKTENVREHLYDIVADVIDSYSAEFFGNGCNLRFPFSIRSMSQTNLFGISFIGSLYPRNALGNLRSCRLAL